MSSVSSRQKRSAALKAKTRLLNSIDSIRSAPSADLQIKKSKNNRTAVKPKSAGTKAVDTKTTRSMKDGVNATEKTRKERAAGEAEKVSAVGKQTKSRTVKQKPISSSRVLARRDTKEIALMRETHLMSKGDMLNKGIIFPTMSNHIKENNRGIVFYRTIRTQLLLKSRQSNFRVLVAGLNEHVDASAFTLNLASCFAFEPNRTSLIVDCNTQQSKLAETLNVPNNYGVTDFLIDKNVSPSSIIYSTGIRRLRYIAPGTMCNSSAEIYSTQRSRALFDILKRRYTDRYIFMHASTMSNSVDAKILSEHADFVLILVPYGKASEQEILNAANLIGKKKLAGMIMHQPEPKTKIDELP